MSKPKDWMNASLNLYKTWLENLTGLTSPPPPPTIPFMQWSQGLRDYFQNLSSNPILSMIPLSSYTGMTTDIGMSYLAYQEALTAYNAKLWETWLESWTTFVSQYPKLVKKTAQDPKEMYREWLVSFKTTYDKMFRTEEFSKILANLLDKSLDMRKASDNLLQEFLKKSSIPTREEVDELQREIYELKRQLRSPSSPVKPATRRNRK